MAKNYKKIAQEVRKKALSMIHKGQTAHIASNFSVADLAVTLYENLGKNDRVVWSKGWAAATTYVLLARRGYFPEKDLDKFPNPPYINLVEFGVPGVETTAGSMGHGLPVALGIALGQKKLGNKARVFCIMSDGELNEGTTWESVMIAAHQELDNLTVLVDRNGWQAMGRTEDVLKLEPIEDKFRAFGWNAARVGGHDYEAMEKEILKKNSPKKPNVIICDTLKGKGVSFMEDSLVFHYKYVDDEVFRKAMEEL
ncbi:MAG TPA: transketolase [Patescibacteria group bacterium]|nr:transketolase [Patescibacteria group bacterium]